MTNTADSDFGKEVGLVHKMIVTGRKVGANRRFYTALADNEDLFRKVVELINGEPTQESYGIVIDYGLSLEGMIRAGGYDWINNDIISDHFPIEGNGTKSVTVELLHFNRMITNDEVLSEMKKRGLRPAKIEELLALGSKYPDPQRQFPIIAFGSVWRDPDGYRYVPELWGLASERRLRLSWLGRRWLAGARFLAVRK